MFRQYRKITSAKKKLPLKEDRFLILQAKKGNSPAQKKLLLHLIGFILFRIETTLYPQIIRDYGDDIFQECIIFVEKKIIQVEIQKEKTISTSRASQLIPLEKYHWLNACLCEKQEKIQVSGYVGDHTHQ